MTTERPEKNAAQDSILTGYMKYLSLGLIPVSLNFLILTTLVEGFDANPTFSSALAFLCATTLNYILQYRWTFRATRKHVHVFPRYMFVTVCTVGLKIGMFWALNNLIGLWYLFSQALTVLVTSFINFLSYRRFTFS